jgi:hypothetical protein
VHAQLRRLSLPSVALPTVGKCQALRRLDISPLPADSVANTRSLGIAIAIGTVAAYCTPLTLPTGKLGLLELFPYIRRRRGPPSIDTSSAVKEPSVARYQPNGQW